VWRSPSLLHNIPANAMKKIIFAVLACVLSFSNPSLSFAADQSYEMSVKCRTDSDLSLKRVTITNDETILDMEYVSTGSNKISVYPPGHDMAFYISDVASGKRYNLLDMEGIAIKPNRNHLGQGDVLKFRLTFEKISMNRFHLIEGKLPTESSITWHFTNIKLQQPQ
jgi:hypothetical protein